MSYNKQTWSNNVTAIDEEKMNHIETGIKNIDNKINNVTGAEEYSTTATYTAGDYCIHNNILYRAKTNATGTWVSSKWEEISIMDEVLTKNNVAVHYLYRGDNTGDCTLIKTTNNNILIDLGNTTATTLINKLISKGVSKIDYVIISHFHSDHTLSSPDVSGDPENGYANTLGRQWRLLLANQSVDFSECKYYIPKDPVWENFVYSDTEDTANRDKKGAYYVPDLTSTIKNILKENYGEEYYNENVITPLNNSILNIDDVTFKFLNTPESANADFPDDYYTTIFGYTFNNGTSSEYTKYITSYNNFSLVVEMTHHNNKFLFTGDIEAAAEEEIVNQLSPCNAYKVEHHGVNTNVNQDFFNRIIPDVAIVMNTTSTVPWTRPMVPALKSLGIPIYSTNYSHDIIIISTQTGLQTVSEKGRDRTFFDSLIGLSLAQIRDIYSLGASSSLNEIPLGGDLNDYTTAGIYKAKSSTNIVNSPFGNKHNFKLIVEYTLNNLRIRQTAQSTVSAETYVRFIQLDYDLNGVTVPKYFPWEKIKTDSITNKLTSGTNLNNVLEVGEYISTTAENSQSLQNCPHTTSAFKLKVEWLHDTSRYRQTIYAANATSDTYVRSYTEAGWQSWRKFTTSAAT